MLIQITKRFGAPTDPPRMWWDTHVGETFEATRLLLGMPRQWEVDITRLRDAGDEVVERAYVPEYCATPADDAARVLAADRVAPCGCPRVEKMAGEWVTMHILGRCVTSRPLRALPLAPLAPLAQERQLPLEIEIGCPACGTPMSTRFAWAWSVIPGGLQWISVPCPACYRTFTVERITDPQTDDAGQAVRF
jgi:hypothetical protein